VLRAPFKIWMPRAASLGLALVVGAACFRAGPPPEASPTSDGAAAPSPQSPDAPANEATRPSSAAPPDAVQLSPYNLVLPRATEDARDDVRQFFSAATRAVKRVYEDDQDDPSVLLALQEQLRSRPELSAAAPVWQAPLASAVARATTLHALGPTLRALRAAMANAYYDETARSYRDVDLRACKLAFSNPSANDEALASFVVTVEPLGTFPLGKFRQFCGESRTLSLRERHLSGRPAPPAVTQLVRRLYAHLHRSGQVRKVGLVHGWQRDAKTSQTTLEAVVGVRRGEQQNGEAEPCVLEHIEIVRPQPRRGAPTLIDVGDSEGILCTELK
jgi:hypothetical protein